MNRQAKCVCAILLVGLGVACRLLPHAWNVAPVAAAAMFAGVYLGTGYAIALPVATLAIGDMAIGFYQWPLMLAVYGSFIVAGLIGVAIKKQKSPATVAAGSIVSSTIFFLTTNAAVWFFSGWYTQNISGLLESYTMALPFFRNTLIGDLGYATLFFGLAELAVQSQKITFFRLKNLFLRHNIV